MSYHPEPYWSRVAREIGKRGPQNYVAGDENPFFRYKRQKLLACFLGKIDFRSKTILEVGPGPGGNLLQVARAGAKRAIGVDISSEMLRLAAENLKGYESTVELHKTDGYRLPLPDKAVDLAFTVTVLQHNTDVSMFQSAVAEMCRVTREMIVLMEDTGRRPTRPSPNATVIKRPVEVYEAECQKHGFQLAARQYLGLWVSRKAYDRVQGWLVSPNHQEGEPYGLFPVMALKLLLAFTRPFDYLVPDDRDLTKMVFVRRAEKPNESRSHH
jgi:ubiquinone/menaquinone biosynthesis C-methylase UbiE